MKTKILAVLTAGMLMLSMAPVQAKSGSSVSYLSMTINDSFTNANVTSDGRGAYTDHDLTTNPDTCVGASLSANGFTQVQQNYLKSTRPNVWCNAAQGSAFTARYWKMHISDDAACDALSPSIDTSDACTVGPMNNTDYERIFPGNAFSSSSSHVVFQFTQNGTGYSVQTDGNATIAPGALNNTRTVKYTGTAKLYHSGTAISGSFSFAFQLELEKF